MAKPSAKLIQQGLDDLANAVNLIAAQVKSRYGKDAIVYFECTGQICVLRGETEAEKHKELSPAEKQTHVLLTAENSATFDCGAW